MASLIDETARELDAEEKLGRREALKERLRLLLIERDSEPYWGSARDIENRMYTLEHWR